MSEHGFVAIKRLQNRLACSGCQDFVLIVETLALIDQQLQNPVVDAALAAVVAAYEGDIARTWDGTKPNFLRASARATEIVSEHGVGAEAAKLLASGYNLVDLVAVAAIAIAGSPTSKPTAPCPSSSCRR